MKKFSKQFSIFLAVLFVYSCGFNKQTSNLQDVSILKVDGNHFLAKQGGLQVKEVDCTLSNGNKTKCLEITSNGIPTDHETGPWCPETIEDAKSEGGLWFKDGEMHAVDGKFIHNLAILYDDKHWLLYDKDGHVIKTNSKADCEKLAGARLLDEYTNYCIECLPEYTANTSRTYTIPLEPQLLDNPTSFGGPGKGGPPPGGGPPDRGARPKGPPPGDQPPGGAAPGGRGPRGLAFNGVPFDGPAPIELILSGYTIPPLDHAGGHVNMDAGYHYHAHTGLTEEIKQADGHAPMIGYALDGIGLYAYKNAKGYTPKDLDQCRGHYDELRGYHYHVDAAGSNNFIDCFRGATASKE